MFKELSTYYPFRVAISLLLAVFTGASWVFFFLQPAGTESFGNPLLWGIISICLLGVALHWQHRLYRKHIQKVLFMLDAIENNDNAIHFNDKERNADTRLVNHALNRVAHILYNVKSETAQQEKYYELILDCVNTGIVVLNDNGAVYQKNNEALRLLGLNVFTHVSQLDRIDPHLTTHLTGCRAGDKMQIPFSNERGSVNLSIRVSDINIRQEHLRILAMNDINNELDEKEIDSWVRLIRVLTHEIMNSVTPITSLSDTLLTLMAPETSPDSQEEIRSGLQTISSTGKSLLVFVESYRKFTRIPTPKPSLFYVKEFIERMVELAHYQYPDARVCIQTKIVPDNLILYADENLISQVVTNLLKNAIQAIETEANKRTEGNIRIKAYCNETENVLIEITNDGPVIPPDIAEHIFIPFFTTKEGGSGIGLSISRQIMRLSGGSIALLPGKETTFVLKFN